MKQYQYYVHVWLDEFSGAITDQQIQDDLNELGSDGWRLVTIERSPWDGSRRVTAYLERII